MKRKVFYTAAIIVFAINEMVAQSGGSPSSVLNSQSSEVTNSIKAVTNWVMAIVGLVSLVQAILIFTSSQGTGEEKMKKAGTWIFMVVFMALGFIISKALFPST